MIDPKNLREVVTVLKEFGVTHFKTNDFEMSLSGIPNSITTTPSPSVTPKMAEGVSTPEVTPEKIEEIKHNIENLMSVMNMGDNELLDRLFPDTQMEEAE